MKVSHELIFFKPTIVYVMIVFVVWGSRAQQPQLRDSLARFADVNYIVNDNKISFSPVTPALTQIAGAPKAFYSYYWEFGDGNYSFEKEPQHTYQEKGDYTVGLWATNNYDVGKPPATRPQKVKVNKTTYKSEDKTTVEGDFYLKRNREPMPAEEMVLLAGYKNDGHTVNRGKIYVFYNEKKFRNDNFTISEIRLHHNERLLVEDKLVVVESKDNKPTLFATAEINMYDALIRLNDTTKTKSYPLTLEESRETYRNEQIIEFDNMRPGESRNLFFTLKTPLEMVKDTSAIISVRALYVPDENFSDYTVKNMEMEIVTSHDPNKMSSNGSLMNYRLVRFKRLKYKIRFQNDGEGPARSIKLETDIPEMLDKSSLKIIDMYPKCRICPKKEVLYSCLDTVFAQNQVIFSFKNIYLPGTAQKGVTEKDSTKGFVKYSIGFKKNFHKKNTKSRTAIVFDKNEPIVTNYARTRFLPGLSPGIRTGFRYHTGLDNSESYFASFTLSPYKSYRWYWQAEVTGNYLSYENKTSEDQILQFQDVINDFPSALRLQRTEETTEFQKVKLEIPLLARYNINNYLGIGMGPAIDFDISERITKTTYTRLYEDDTDNFLLSSTTERGVPIKNGISDLGAAFLFDFTAGFARIGPSLGVRYAINSKSDFNHWQFYAIWKF